MKEEKELGAMVKVPCYNSSWIRRNFFLDLPTLWSSGVESRLVRKIVRVRIIASRNRRYALGKGIKDKMLNCTNPAGSPPG